ncbi:MAG: acylneuraminate cytidylyltransferase [Bacteroidetes bacterium RIFCSPHIGHO2_02_FULL_44_7]|nr:MAG: acylneuraminate cytidylyltransferase [Bacteroidetes bacterium RIFCSPHIGHO2_02_FULL_44_7]
MLPKLIITDIDGVWTDGGMYYDNKGGNEWKKFNTSDSAGILFCMALGIEVAVLTGEDTKIVQRRCDKLGITELHMGVKNKLKLAQNLCVSRSIELSEVAFIGDDINDLPLLREVGISGAPSSARTYIQKEVHIVTELKGGEGAFREFVERILVQEGKLEEALAFYVKTIS